MAFAIVNSGSSLGAVLLMLLLMVLVSGRLVRRRFRAESTPSKHHTGCIIIYDISDPVSRTRQTHHLRLLLPLSLRASVRRLRALTVVARRWANCR